MQLLCCCATVTYSCPTLLHFIQFTSVQHSYCPGVEIQRAAESEKHILQLQFSTPTLHPPFTGKQKTESCSLKKFSCRGNSLSIYWNVSVKSLILQEMFDCLIMFFLVKTARKLHQMFGWIVFNNYYQQWGESVVSVAAANTTHAALLQVELSVRAVKSIQNSDNKL